MDTFLKLNVSQYPQNYDNHVSWAENQHIRMTGVMMLEIQFCIPEINDILKHSNRKQLF